MKGCKQQYGLDYNEIFAHVACLETVCLFISLTTLIKWKILQIVIKSNFLNSYLEEEFYIEQPFGYVQQGHEEKVYKQKKALYGLKMPI